VNLSTAQIVGTIQNMAFSIAQVLGTIQMQDENHYPEDSIAQNM
jgi:hypothetical protein